LSDLQIVKMKDGTSVAYDERLDGWFEVLGENFLIRPAIGVEGSVNIAKKIGKPRAVENRRGRAVLVKDACCDCENLLGCLEGGCSCNSLPEPKIDILEEENPVSVEEVIRGGEELRDFMKTFVQRRKISEVSREELLMGGDKLKSLTKGIKAKATEEAEKSLVKRILRGDVGLADLGRC